MASSITFPKTSADTWTNIETSMEIHRDNGVYIVCAPSKFRNGFPVSGDMRTLSEARAFAKTYVSAVVRPWIAKAFDDATAEDAERSAVIHHVTRYGNIVSCGVTGRVRVEYTASKVTCEACKTADYQRLVDIAYGQAIEDNAEIDRMVALTDDSEVRRIADGLTSQMRGALGTGHASSHSATVLGRGQVIDALRRRGLVGSDDRWTALGFRVAAVALTGRVKTIDDLHAEALAENRDRSARVAH